MLPFSTLLRISRPRFWHYVLGPMLILFASSDFFEEIQGSFMGGGTDWVFYGIVMMIILGYFTLPANLWIYGWNDIADGDTDKFNKKKGDYEIKVEDTTTIKKKLKKSIWIWSIGYIVCGTGILASVFDYSETRGNVGWPGRSNFFGLLLGGVCLLIVPFLITSYLYSCKPLRAKAKPFIDGIMNILYIVTPIIIGSYFSFQKRSNTIHSAPDNLFRIYQTICIIIPSLFRCMAMHCYSAIPDIEPDSQAGLNTTAVYLGKQKSLIYCIILYLLSAILSFPALGWFSIVAGIVYISMMIISYTKKDVFGLYKMFPWINLVVGFCLFWYIILINH